MTVREAYNNWSKQYDSNANKTRDLDVVSTRETLLKYSWSRVLELGCGTGKNTRFLCTKAKEVVAVDFAEDMLSIAKQKVKNRNVQFISMNLLEDWNSVQDDYFDMVTSSLTLEHIQDIQAIFRKVYTKLAKGGYFFISEIHPAKQYIGSQARYEENGVEYKLEVYIHHISDYMQAAKKAGFRFIELEEWFDNPPMLPRLISFVFQK